MQEIQVYDGFGTPVTLVIGTILTSYSVGDTGYSLAQITTADGQILSKCYIKNLERVAVAAE